MDNLADFKKKIQEIQEYVIENKDTLGRTVEKLTMHLSDHVNTDLKMERILKEYEDFTTYRSNYNNIKKEIDIIKKTISKTSYDFESIKESIDTIVNRETECKGVVNSDIEDLKLKIAVLIPQLDFIKDFVNRENERFQSEKKGLKSQYKINILGWITLVCTVCGSLWGVGVWGVNRFDKKEHRLSTKYDSLRVSTDSKINKIDKKIDRVLNFILKNNIKKSLYGQIKINDIDKIKEQKYPFELLYKPEQYFIWDNVSDRNSIQYTASKKGMKVSCRKIDNDRLMVIRVK